MTEWTDRSMERWADYLDEVRIALSGSEDTEAVIRDLEDHATRSFAGVTHAVTEAEMNALIARLGSAEDIAAGADPMPGIAEAAGRSGAVLGYASLALLALGMLLSETALGALPLAYILARVGLRRSEGGSSPSDRWLLYPALAVGALCIVALLSFWPFVLVLPLAAIGGPIEAWMREAGMTSDFGTTAYWLTAWAIAALTTGLWWVGLGAALRRAPGSLLFLLQPFVKHQRDALTIGRVLLRAGLVLFLFVAVLILILW